MGRCLRMHDTEHLTGLSRWTIGRMEACGKFPKRIRLTGRAFGHDEDEVAAWLAGRKKARDRLAPKRRRQSKPTKLQPVTAKPRRTK